MRRSSTRARPWLLAACLAAASCGERAEQSNTAPEAAAPSTVDLKIGDAAPDFSLPGSDGHTYALSSYAGRQTVVLAWFAKAFTDG